ncbi:methyltransferase domain-containing protein [Flammeovirga sp. MY04]|uniref:methyltransferase domain-containing protein n=1 Tax=Flammeovirga sp. MY04 TaxID=1191459 RepID=UPI00130536A8|nr:methyltransferase domain-containing protein [Flammeovirga sp. MY04]ANQ47913.2 methyltransferase domain-containing protein [Flammeovirga sp. MY04]
MLMIPLDKSQVQHRFGKNVESYVYEASIQKEICDELYDEIITHEITFNNAFEIGCGCGFLTDLLIDHVRQYEVNDLHRNCTHQLLDKHDHLKFREGDAESISFPSELNLICSASALQWMTDLDVLIEKVNQSLLPDGYFMFSTFGPDNFKQIKEITGNGLEYHELTHWEFLLEKHQFEVIKSWEWKKDLLFDKGTDVLRHIKKTGVNGMSSEKSVWNRNKLLKFNEAYNFYQTSGKVPLTYHPIFIIAKKK